MAKDKNIGLTAEKLKELGVPEELIDKILETGGPSVNTHAEGGNGGSAVSLTYVDNYSVLFLVYTFLLQTVNNGNAKDKETKQLNKALLSTLQTAMKEQQEYRKAFLRAINILNNQNK
ncbi:MULTISPECIES: hypothetical protein [Niallia]|jgi:hypothetical protein|uniref:Uncharacterized protein n=1 Tax=Niallia circulans TaxID=1397 RepID=A0A268FG09_NIACI|nr:hypothetical protein [Niallia circulans]AYV66089.1 hypothetical protein C2I06_03910 [Niallia circulans]AYV71092.1 hypothetical protein C2H98_05610 [Niallia circulans]NRG27497.1 hypothetical protein [Niallia circulans]PAD84316.1 hypothetical protein CHH57_05340 [Niallia circulans]UQZ73459.1 hypothetical protein C2I17_02180 [Niallia circulans]